MKQCYAGMKWMVIAQYVDSGFVWNDQTLSKTTDWYSVLRPPFVKLNPGVRYTTLNRMDLVSLISLSLSLSVSFFHSSRSSSFFLSVSLSVCLSVYSPLSLICPIIPVRGDYFSRLPAIFYKFCDEKYIRGRDGVIAKLAKCSCSAIYVSLHYW